MYKDKAAQLEAQRKAMERKRKAVNPDVNPNPSDGWPDVIAYIERDA